MTDYANLRHVRVLGQGTFGKVYECVSDDGSVRVAIKKLQFGSQKSGIPSCAYAELRALHELRHPNIVSLLGVVPKHGRLNLVLEYCETDLYNVIRDTKLSVCPSAIKCIMRMLLEGLAYCHAAGFVHQDLKPSNLLLDARGCLKLADFGLAVQLDTPEPYLFHQVVTLQCRAPELLLGARYHGRGVDLWAVGCILADMLCGAALFDKESEIQQLMAIVKALGSPSVATWPGLAKIPCAFEFVEVPPTPWATLLPECPPDAIDLVSRFLVYNPGARLDAHEALSHPYFVNEPLPCAPDDLMAIFAAHRLPPQRASSDSGDDWAVGGAHDSDGDDDNGSDIDGDGDGDGNSRGVGSGSDDDGDGDDDARCGRKRSKRLRTMCNAVLFSDADGGGATGAGGGATGAGAGVDASGGDTSTSFFDSRMSESTPGSGVRGTAAAAASAGGTEPADETSPQLPTLRKSLHRVLF